MSAPKIIAQLVIIGTQILGRAFMEAYREAAAASAKEAAKGAAAGSALSKKLGMSVEEAMLILNVNKESPPEDVAKRYEALFQANDPKAGGSFYLQSKIFRARERLMVEQEKLAEELNLRAERQHDDQMRIKNDRDSSGSGTS